MISNRRRFSRIPVDLDAVLCRGERQYAARVRNFCSGGMLIESNGATDLKDGMRLRVDVQVDSGQDGAGVSFDLEVRHSDPPYIGVAFIQPAFAALQRLHQCTASPMAVPETLVASSGTELAQFRERFFEQLDEAVAESLLETDRDLRAAAETTSLDAPRNNTVARLQNTLSKGAAELARAVRRQLDRNLTDFIADRGNEVHADGADPLDRLALVERTQFESWLVANIAARTVEARMDVTLHKLATLFQQALKRPVPAELNPVAPGAVVHQLHVELRALEFGDDELTFLYRYLSPVLAAKLKEAYGAALWDVTPAALARPGRSGAVGPKAAQAPSADLKPVPSSTASSIQSSEMFGKSAMPTTGRQVGADTVATLRSLLSLRKDVSGEEREASDATAAGLPEYSLGELQQVVEGLALSALRQTVAPVDLKQEIMRSLRGFEGAEGRPLPGPEAELIEVTERLFQAIEANPAVHQILKRHLSRLQYVVLQTVLKDQTFFASDQHPLRQLLNQLGRLAAGRLAPGQLEILLERMIDQVATEPDSVDMHNALLVQVRTQLQRQELGLERAIERIGKSADGERRLRAAQRQVGAEVRKRLLGRQIPELVLQLLYDLGWRQHLLVSRLKQERAYRKALAIIDVLVQRAEVTGQTAAGALNADNLRALVNTELALLPANAGIQSWRESFDEWLDGRQTATLVLVEPDRLKSLEAPFAAAQAELSPNTPVSVDAEKRGPLSELQVGDWLLLPRPDSADLYLKLAWCDGASFRFAYLDDQGIQSIAHSAGELGQWLERGVARRLDERDWSLVEQGLYRVVHSVYEDVLTKVNRDPLTDLVTRHEFEMQLERYLARARADGSRHTLCYVDIDRFRVVNNTLGVQAGDALLKSMADFLRQQSAANVILARLGGNEYGALLPDCPKRLGLDLAEQLRAAVEAQTFSHGEQPFKVTLSIGVATLSDQVDNLSELLKRASLACLAAKEQGGNRVRAYQPSSRDQARQQEMMSWLPRLERPLEELVTLRCQPIVPLRQVTGLAHYEVLLAIRGAGDSLLSPVPLIEAAEKFNRMTRVDRWVIEQIFRWLRSNPQKLAKIDGFSINLSGNSLNDELFLSNLLELLRKYPDLSRKVCFEVTETAAVTSLSTAADFVRQVKQCGCRLSLDDFGTGLSSYAYLQQLPVDYVKIDGVFVRNLVDNPKDQALVKSIAELARFLGIETIGEYVENQQVLDVLKQLGVDHVQGYHLGKPVLLEHI